MNAHPESGEEDTNAVGEKIAIGLSDHGYSIVDDFLSPIEVTNLRQHMDHLHEEGDFKQAGIGASHKFQVNRDIRKDWIHWVDPRHASPETQQFTDRIRHIMTHINRSCFLGLKDCEMHYAIYPTDSYYKRHLDQFQFSDHRRLTFLCYLNPGWTVEDGGLLRMYLKNEAGEETPVDVIPLAGRLVIFRSNDIEHEVLRCHRPRYSLTGWMLDQLNELTFL